MAAEAADGGAGPCGGPAPLAIVALPKSMIGGSRAGCCLPTLEIVWCRSRHIACWARPALLCRATRGWVAALSEDHPSGGGEKGTRVKYELNSKMSNNERAGHLFLFAVASSGWCRNAPNPCLCRWRFLCHRREYVARGVCRLLVQGSPANRPPFPHGRHQARCPATITNERQRRSLLVRECSNGYFLNEKCVVASVSVTHNNTSV